MTVCAWNRSRIGALEQLSNRVFSAPQRLSGELSALLRQCRERSAAVFGVPGGQGVVVGNVHRQ